MTMELQTLAGQATTKGSLLASWSDLLLQEASIESWLQRKPSFLVFESSPTFMSPPPGEMHAL